MRGLETTMESKLLAVEDCLHGRREFEVIFDEFLGHCVNERLIGKLNLPTQRKSQELAAELL